eukprot:g34559.t1
MLAQSVTPTSCGLIFKEVTLTRQLKRKLKDASYLEIEFSRAHPFPDEYVLPEMRCPELNAVTPALTSFLKAVLPNIFPLGSHVQARRLLGALGKSCIFPVTRDAIDFLLSKNGSGNAVIIVIGGAAESLDCNPGSNIVTLKNRKGFVKIALQN